MSVGTGLLTVEEFLRLPDPREGHNELHHGEVIVMPPPKRGHQRLQRRLEYLLQRLAGDRYVVEIEMAFRPTPEHEVWQADVGCVLRKREEAAGPDEYLMGAPELVVEVLSPGNTVDEINDKMSTCMANGGLSFWTVDAKRKGVSVTGGAITKHYGIADVIFCQLLSAQIRVADIFEHGRS